MAQNKSPIDFFFSLGDKATGGDPKKKADFDYYMLWVMFFAFVVVLLSNLIGFFNGYDFSKLGWSLVVFAILWFQYNTLKTAREARKYQKMLPGKDEKEVIEEAEDMLKGFEQSSKRNNQQDSSEISKDKVLTNNEVVPLRKEKNSKNLFIHLADIPTIFTLNKIYNTSEKGGVTHEKRE